jgi:hypothetical protein
VTRPRPLIAFQIKAAFILAILLGGLVFSKGAAHADIAAITNDPAPSHSTFPDIPSFLSYLRNLRGTIVGARSGQRMGTILGSLPESWSVKSSEGDFQIDAEPLRDDLAQAARDEGKRASSISEAVSWIDDLSAQIENYPQSPLTDRKAAAITLQHILSNREFAPATKENALDRVRKRINTWIQNFIRGLFEKMSRHPIGAKVVLWSVLILALIWLAASIVRVWQRQVKTPGKWVPGTMVPKLSSQEWVRKARQASERGDYREAIHCAYWAGIVYLQSTEALPEDLSLTPREYLRGLSGPSAAEKQMPLKQSTKRLERIWYGLFPANIEDFQGSMQDLRELGYPMP